MSLAGQMIGMALEAALGGAKVPPPKVERYEGPRILVPTEVPYSVAADYCQKKAAEEDAVTPFTRKFHCLPWSGGWATEQVLMREYSATAKKTSEVLVPSAGGKVKKVRWGTWDIAGLGLLQQEIDFHGEDGPEYTLTAHVPRKWGDRAEALLERIQDEINKRELYAGCAVVLQPDEEGDLYLEQPPKVIDIEMVPASSLVLSEAMAKAVRSELFYPITNSEDLIAAKVSPRRGVLLSGRPGTGKTMSSRIAAALAVARGWTVFYLPDARGIEKALRIASTHQPSVLICEDIDRQLRGDRTASIDRILNALDGLDRQARVVFIGTTNDDKVLPAPLLRPGRLDSTLVFGLPDAHAAGTLLNQYLGERAIRDREDLELAAHECAGLLPASIREVAARSILHALEGGHGGVTADDVMTAAVSVKAQQARLEAAERGSDKVIPEVRVHLDKSAQDGTDAAISVAADARQRGHEAANYARS